MGTARRLKRERAIARQQENERFLRDRIAMLERAVVRAATEHDPTITTVATEIMQERREKQREKKKPSRIPTPKEQEERENRKRARHIVVAAAKVQRESIARRNETTSLRAGDIVRYRGSEMTVLSVSPVGAVLTLEHPAMGILTTPAAQAIFLRKS
jgi:hypothetical protein